ncbi:MAG: tetratricopeptide repeat protein [Proteobacteria bacterium]|nr:tetratricopeptide repeat protein [Pseudomonadota bacterium]
MKLTSTQQDEHATLRTEKRERDINTLFTMLQLTKARETNPDKRGELIIQVSKLAGGKEGISFDDKNEDSIRNRYGYIQRNISNRQNPNPKGRIFWEHLYRLHTIIEKNPNTNLTQLYSDLPTLKAKLTYILRQEVLKEEQNAEAERCVVDEQIKKELLSTSQSAEELNLVEAEMPFITSFIQEHYQAIALFTMNAAIKAIQDARALPHFGIKLREYKYVVARNLVVIGELCNEFKIDYNAQGNSTQEVKALVSLFSDINDIRDNFLHEHEMLLRDFSHEQAADRAAYLLKDFGTAFSELLSHKTIDAIANGAELVGKCGEYIRKLNAVLFEPIEVRWEREVLSMIREAILVKKVCASTAYINLMGLASSSSMPNNIKELTEQSRAQSDSGKILEAEKCLKDITDEAQRSSTKEAIRQLKQYIIEEKLSEEYKSLLKQVLTRLSYPALDVDNKGQKANMCKEIAVITGQKTHALITMLNNKNAFSLPSIPSLQDKYSKWLTEISESKTKTYPSLEQYKGLEFSILSVGELEKKYPAAAKHKDEFVVLHSFLAQIHNEIDFLIKVEANANLEPSIKQSIKEHVITVIGQCVSEIAERGQFSNAFISNISQVASRNSKVARDKGLAHEGLSLEQEKITLLIEDDVLPAFQDFAAISAVYEWKAGKLPNTTMLLNNIGVAHTRLGLYEQAVECFEKALNHLKSNPKAVEREKMERVDFVLSNPTMFIEFDEVAFGIDTYEFEVKSNLANTYVLAGQYDKAKELSKQIISSIDSAVLQGAPPKFKDEVAIVIHYSGASLFQVGLYAEAAELYNSITEHLVQDPKLKETFQSNVSQCHAQLGHYDQAYIETAINSQNPQTKFSGLMTKCGWLIKSQQLSEAGGVIQELEQLVQKESRVLKRSSSDRYMLLLVNIVELKLALVQARPNLQAVHGIEVEAKTLLLSLPTKLKQSLEAGNVYRKLCDLKCLLINDPNRVWSNKNEALGLLTSAQKDFEQASQIPSHSNKMRKVATNLAATLSNAATYHVTDWEMQRELLLKALEMQKQYGANTVHTSINLGIVFNNHATALNSQRNLESAILYYKKALTCFEQLLGDQYRRTMEDKEKREYYRTFGIAYEGLADCQGSKKIWAQASNNYKAAIQLYEAFLALDTEGEDNNKVMEYKQKCVEKAAEVLNSQLQWQQIEVLILSSTAWKRIKSTTTDATIAIRVNGIDKELVRDYCQTTLGLARNNPEFDNMECTISLDSKAIQALKDKANSNQQGYQKS